MDIKEAMVNLDLKFTSGNSIQVERATIVRDEWEAIQDFYLKNKTAEFTTLDGFPSFKAALSASIKRFSIFCIITAAAIGILSLLFEIIV